MHHTSLRSITRLGIISSKNIYDEKSWSGTVNCLSRKLASRYTVIPLIVSDTPKKMLRAFLKMTHLTQLWLTPLLWEKLELKNKIAHANCDLILAPAASELLASGAVPSEIPVIYLSDATYHLLMNYYFSDDSEEKKRLLNIVENDALSRADAIIEASEWSAKDAIMFYGADQKKITVLPFGANISEPSDYVYSVKVLGPSINLLLVGVDWSRKGVDIAIDVIRLLNEAHSSHPRYSLTIVGVSPPCGIWEPSIHFVGELNKGNPDELEKLISCYKDADIFILPTKAECAGIVFAEAAMFGLPSFTYATGGVETYVESGITGECLPPAASPSMFAASIQELVNNGKYSVYSKNARAKYEKELNWQSWIENFGQIVQSLSK